MRTWLALCSGIACVCAAACFIIASLLPCSSPGNTEPPRLSLWIPPQNSLSAVGMFTTSWPPSSQRRRRFNATTCSSSGLGQNSLFVCFSYWFEAVCFAGTSGVSLCSDLFGWRSSCVFLEFDSQWKDRHYASTFVLCRNAHVGSFVLLCFVTLDEFRINKMFDKRLNVMDFFHGRNYFWNKIFISIPPILILSLFFFVYFIPLLWQERVIPLTVSPSR
jgi:hypothetical protein